MNELQRTQLELLRQFIRVCEALGLNYYLVCGSALGAVKYGGFIPWDDDIDVALYREDYEVFQEKAQELLPEHVFLQNYRTDSAFPAIFSKLRDSNTTFIERSASRLPIHHGIYIDVFPLDGYPEGKVTSAVFEIRKEVYRRLLSVAFLPNRWWKWLFIGPFRLLGVHRYTGRIARSYERMISSYPVRDAGIIANHGNWQGRLEYAPKSQYGNGCIGTFEGLPVRLPEDCDGYLRQKYGDYHRELEEAQRHGHHYHTLCDCTLPYWEALEEGI